METLDSGSQPSQAGNREFVRYFGDYELLSVIASGGMGVVYKARQIKLMEAALPGVQVQNKKQQMHELGILSVPSCQWSEL